MASPAPARPRQARQANLLQVLALLVAFAMMATLGGVLSAGLVMPAVATASAVTDTSVRLFEDLPTELAEVPLSEKSTILAADGTLLATFFHQNRVVVTLDQVSIHMQNAVVATEDRRFYEHAGVDLQGMTRALVRNATSDEVEGGSTLTQQYVKNALIQAALTTDDPAAQIEGVEAARESEGIEGYARKLREAKYAIALEERMTKPQILEAYLNIAQFGLSVYGVEAAAQRYFSTPAANLNYLQAATIAGVTQAPGLWDPLRNPEGSQTRRDVVLGLMLREGYISQEEHDAGVATPLPASMLPAPDGLGCETANAVANAGYFCDYVTKIIAQNPAFGATQPERARLLYRGGLTIRTTLDPRQQQIADEEVKAGIPVDDPSGVATAISVIEPGTGFVRAMAQNRIYKPSGGGVGETAQNYNTDSAYGSSFGFAPGSTFKPFTLVQWLKEGHSLNERLDARQREFDVGEFNAPCTNLGREMWDPGNAEGDGGFMTVMDATKNSVNSGYLEMASQLNLCGIMDTATSMGVHQANGEPMSPVPANVLGSQAVAPLTMAAAFATFAANGTYCEPIAITSVQDSNGNELPIPPVSCRQVLAPEIAAAMNYALGHVWEGTARSVGGLSDRPSAGKTGTTSRNEHTWFVGYTPQLAAAVWVGYAQGTIPVQNIVINGQQVRYAYGSTVAAPTWKRFMERTLEGAPVLEFPPPSPAQINGVPVPVPSVAGRSEDSAATVLERAGFQVQVSTQPVYSSQPVGTVARTEPSGSASRGAMITLLISGGPDPASLLPPVDPAAAPAPIP